MQGRFILPERYRLTPQERVRRVRARFGAVEIQRMDEECATQAARSRLRAEAYHEYARAVRRRELVRGPCVVCGETDVDGHHEDYSRPLDVVWLCPTHHRKLHREKRANG